MSYQTDDQPRPPGHTPGAPDAPLRPKKPWHAPIVIIASQTDATGKPAHSFEIVHISHFPVTTASGPS